MHVVSQLGWVSLYQLRNVGWVLFSLDGFPNYFRRVALVLTGKGIPRPDSLALFTIVLAVAAGRLPIMFAAYWGATSHPSDSLSTSVTSGLFKLICLENRRKNRRTSDIVVRRGQRVAVHSSRLEFGVLCGGRGKPLGKSPSRSVRDPHEIRQDSNRYIAIYLWRTKAHK
jgi:hypothetical protein